MADTAPETALKVRIKPPVAKTTAPIAKPTGPVIVTAKLSRAKPAEAPVPPIREKRVLRSATFLAACSLALPAPFTCLPALPTLLPVFFKAAVASSALSASVAKPTAIAFMCLFD